MRTGLAACLAATLLMLGCAERRPSVLLVSIDSLRGDQLGATIDGQPLTPRLDALATEGIVYERAIVSAPWTTPSMMSIMTGRTASGHGVSEHDRALASNAETLAERFAAAGYRTAAFVPAVTLRPEFGFDRGFEIYDYEEFGHQRVSSPQLVGKVLSQLERFGDAPSFVWVHLWDPHYNYNAPTPFDGSFRRGIAPPSEEVQCLKWYRDPVTPAQGEYLRGQHEGEVLYTDRYVGELLDELDALGLAQKTIVAVVGDHGEAFLEHGWLGHTNRVDEALVRVPLILRPPGETRPLRIENVVPAAAIGRTLLDAAGIDGAGFGTHATLPPAGDEIAGAAPPITETRRRGCFTAIYHGRHKYVLEHLGCGEAVYDVVADPAESEDLASSDPARLVEMRTLLAERLRAIEKSALPRASLPPAVLEEAEARLRSLSYIGHGAAGDENADDPCRVITRSLNRDSFGDRSPDVACPERGAQACLGEITGR